MAVSNVDERRLTSFSVVADPHVQPRTFRSAPPSGLVMLVPRRCSGGALPRVRYGGLGRRERGRGAGAGAPPPVAPDRPVSPGKNPPRPRRRAPSLCGAHRRLSAWLSQTPFPP